MNLIGHNTHPKRRCSYYITWTVACCFLLGQWKVLVHMPSTPPRQQSKGETNSTSLPAFAMRERSNRSMMSKQPTPTNQSTFAREVNASATLEGNSNNTPTTDSGVGHSAAVCIIAKEEELYLDEWVDYQLLVAGFETIYIYDNSDNFTLQNYTADRAEALLRQLEPTGVRADDDQQQQQRHVIVEHFPYSWRQRAAYKRCFEQHGSQHTWLALLDGDEFLVFNKRYANVVELLTEHCTNGSLSIPWRVFGTANRTTYEPAPVLQRFPYRVADGAAKVANSGTMDLHKVIVRSADYNFASPHQKLGVYSPHSVELVPNATQHDTGGRVTSGVSSRRYTTDYYEVAVLHHYMYKSEEEWRYKWCTRGNVAGFHKRCNEEALVGTVFDDSAWVALKKHAPWYS